MEKIIKMRKAWKPKMAFMTWAVLLLSLTALLIAGCEPFIGGPQTPTSTPGTRDRFTTHRESEDGAIVAWGGYKEGYKAGEDATFDISIKNETDQSWPGRYCLHLLSGHSHTVIATLEQRPFNLEPGVGFSDTITVRLPEGLEPGAYGLSLPVHRPGGSMVDLVSIQVGETSETRPPASQQDMDASLAACPPAEGTPGDAAYLVKLAKDDLAQKLGISRDAIQVEGVEPTEFRDASLGVPEPGKVYAQVVTPGYIIKLTAEGQTYRYHAADERVVAVSGDQGQPSSGDITIKGVQVTDTQVIVRGASTLPDGTCLGTELWAGGVVQDWWPSDACALVEQGAWELAVPLDPGQALEASTQYMMRAYLPGGPDIVATLPFDLDGPAPPPPPQGDATYQHVEVAEAGLSLDVPSGWIQIEPGIWAASGDETLRLGVQWVDVEPPQEVEAALLPQPAQILDSEPVTLPWGEGRRFTLEVYGEAPGGDQQAPVVAMETHVLVEVAWDGGRRAFDIYISAPTAAQHDTLAPTLQRALASVVLEE